MITKQVIDELYQKYCRRHHDSTDSIKLLMDSASEYHNVQMDGQGNLVIGSIDPKSPFHRILVDNINGISQFENTFAIVLNSSIIFLNKYDSGVNVHVRTDTPSLWQRLRWKFARRS
jgi:hypothetical protein